MIAGSSVIAAYAIWWTNHAELRCRVFVNLDSAADNGYFNLGEYLNGMTPEDVAHDLTCFSEDFGGDDASRLEPYVRQWMISRGLI